MEALPKKRTVEVKSPCVLICIDPKAAAIGATVPEVALALAVASAERDEAAEPETEVAVYAAAAAAYESSFRPRSGRSLSHN